MSGMPEDSGEVVECRYLGRDFSRREMAWLRALIADHPTLHRSGLAKAFCEYLGWFKADGGLKDMSARVLLLKMHRDGIITLPPPRHAHHPGRRTRSFTPATDPPEHPLPQTLTDARPLQVFTVTGAGSGPSQRWNEYIARYHYLGFQSLVGAQMRYTVYDRSGLIPLALLGFSAAAWKLAPRDDFIGWSAQQREKNLPRVCNNSRFLILPWARIPNLGSHILSLMRQRLPQDWKHQYHRDLCLIETFVEQPRFNGGVYRASGWHPVGTTQGRGRNDRYRTQRKLVKDIWLCPLGKHWQRILNTD